jgi:hypothetical protein
MSGSSAMWSLSYSCPAHILSLIDRSHLALNIDLDLDLDLDVDLDLGVNK